MASEEASSRASEPPDYLRPGIRCALEMVLAGGLVLLVGLPAENTVFYGLTVVLAVVVMVVILFWALNRQIEAWIRCAQRGGVGD
jgi:hypothetical protein